MPSFADTNTRAGGGVPHYTTPCLDLLINLEVSIELTHAIHALRKHPNIQASKMLRIGPLA